MNNKLEDMILSVQEHIALLEQSNRNPEKFKMLLKTLQEKQTKRQGRQLEVKDVKQVVKPDDSESETDFEIDLDPQMDVEFDFEPSQPKIIPKWDDLIRKSEGDDEC